MALLLQLLKIRQPIIDLVLMRNEKLVVLCQVRKDQTKESSIATYQVHGQSRTSRRVQSNEQERLRCGVYSFSCKVPLSPYELIVVISNEQHLD
jgi:hypothetical protein